MCDARSCCVQLRATGHNLTFHALLACIPMEHSIRTRRLHILILSLAAACQMAQHIKSTHLLVWQCGQINTTQCSCLTLITCICDQCYQVHIFYLSSWHMLWLMNMSVSWRSVTISFHSKELTGSVNPMSFVTTMTVDFNEYTLFTNRRTLHHSNYSYLAEW